MNAWNSGSQRSTFQISFSNFFCLPQIVHPSWVSEERLLVTCVAQHTKVTWLLLFSVCLTIWFKRMISPTLIPACSRTRFLFHFHRKETVINPGTIKELKLCQWKLVFQFCPYLAWKCFFTHSDETPVIWVHIFNCDTYGNFQISQYIH